MDKRHYVYLLRCADGSLYTGMTPDIARRLRQHVERLPGCAKYTRSHPVTANRPRASATSASRLPAALWPKRKFSPTTTRTGSSGMMT